MNIGLGLGCLVAMAVVGGVKLGDYCLCNYDPTQKGCILGEIEPAPFVCQCTLNAGYCLGEVAKCEDSNSPHCKNSGKNYENCRQGVYNGAGNCCGYHNADGNCISTENSLPNPLRTRTNVAPPETQLDQAGNGVQSDDLECRYWCKKPNKRNFCCEFTFQPISPPFSKQGNCPVIRDSCPKPEEYRINISAEQCSSDGSCEGTKRCCWDKCLDHYTCKSINN